MNLYTRRLALAEQKTGALTSEDLDKISKEIDRAYLALLSASKDGNMATATDAALRVEEALRQYAVLVGHMTEAGEQPDALRAAVAELLKGYPVTGEYVTDRKESGYFYYDTDGYELLYDVEEVMTMSPEEFLALTQEPAQTYQNGGSGKIVYSSTWYAAAYVSLADVAETAFEVGERYNVVCDDSRGTQLPMTVVRMEPTADGALIVFKTNAMPEGFEFKRRFTAQTVSGSVSGYRVPTEALVTLESSEGKPVVGVYILEGNVVEFRRVHIRIAHDGYTVVATYEEVNAMLDALPNEERDQFTADGWPYLRLNDKIITRGTGLYDGKMIS